MSVYAVPVEAPTGMAQCPVHGTLVATAGGFLLGRCDGCCVEVALALAWLKNHPRKAA